MAKIHFIPRFILERFKADAPLLEFDKTAGIATPRSVENAGQRENYWPEGIEKGLMQRLDDTASKILERNVYDKSSIALQPKERRKLAQWIGLLMIRVPNHEQRYVEQRQMILDNPEDIIAAAKHGGAMAIYEFMKQRANRREVVFAREIAGRPALAHLVVLSFWELLIRQGDSAALLDDHEMFVRSLEQFNNHEKFADWLQRMRWDWLIDTKGSFVIGDEPVCSFRPNPPARVGIRVLDVEVTIPLSRKLCLMLTNSDPALGTLIRPSAEHVKALNRRQIKYAYRYVYGPTQVSLRPDDPNAEYGF